MNQQKYEQAKLAGRSAREAGRSRDSRPTYAIGPDGSPLREAWLEGWDEADAERKKRA